MIINLPLRTERLILRDFEEADWESVHTYASDPEVVRYMEWGPDSEEDTSDFIQRVITHQRAEPRRHFELAVVLKEEDRLIGGCGISVEGHLEGSIGYCYSRHFWGREYATEAGETILAFGFEQLGLHRIFATCDTESVASAKVLEKIGMRQEGHLREDSYEKGRWRDSFLYAMLEHEWNQVERSG